MATIIKSVVDTPEIEGANDAITSKTITITPNLSKFIQENLEITFSSKEAITMSLNTSYTELEISKAIPIKLPEYFYDCRELVIVLPISKLNSIISIKDNLRDVYIDDEVRTRSVALTTTLKFGEYLRSDVYTMDKVDFEVVYEREGNLYKCQTDFGNKKLAECDECYKEVMQNGKYISFYWDQEFISSISDLVSISFYKDNSILLGEYSELSFVQTDSVDIKGFYKGSEVVLTNNGSLLVEFDVLNMLEDSEKSLSDLGHLNLTMRILHSDGVTCIGNLKFWLNNCSKFRDVEIVLEGSSVDDSDDWISNKKDYRIHNLPATNNDLGFNSIPSLNFHFRDVYGNRLSQMETHANLNTLLIDGEQLCEKVILEDILTYYVYVEVYSDLDGHARFKKRCNHISIPVDFFHDKFYPFIEVTVENTYEIVVTSDEYFYMVLWLGSKSPDKVIYSGTGVDRLSLATFITEDSDIFYTVVTSKYAVKSGKVTVKPPETLVCPPEPILHVIRISSIFIVALEFLDKGTIAYMNRYDPKFSTTINTLDVSFELTDNSTGIGELDVLEGTVYLLSPDNLGTLKSTDILEVGIGPDCKYSYKLSDYMPPEVLETLPPEFTYTPESNPDDGGNSQLYRVTTTVVSNITTNTSDITIGEYYLPQDEFIIGVEYTTFEAILSEEPYVSNGVTIYTNLLPNINSVDDIEFSISNVETRQLDYSISSTDHFNYQDMFGNKPIIAAIEPTVLSELYAGTISMGPVRSIYIVNQYNGNEVYMVAEDGNLGKISDNIYTNHIEYYPLQAGVTYNTPIVGKYDGVIIFNSSTGSVLFDGSYRTDPEDNTILENDSEWYKVNYSNKRVVERSIF